MRSVYVVVAVLSLLSSGHSAPVDNCGNLTQQLEIQSRDQLLGKWIAVAESTDIPAFRLLMEMFIDNSFVKVTARNDSDIIQLFQVLQGFGKCFTLKYNMTLKNSTLTIERPRVYEILLKTSCPDCLIVNSTIYLEKGSYHSLQLLSKRNKVSDAELEEYKKQVQCLNLPEPAVLDPEKELCQEESLSQDTQNKDPFAVMNDMGREFISAMKSLANTEDGINFLKLVHQRLET